MAANRLSTAGGVNLPISDEAEAAAAAAFDYPERNPRPTTHTLKSQKRNEGCSEVWVLSC